MHNQPIAHIILESPYYADYKILNESKDTMSGKWKFKIKAVLQRANERNQNGRIYPKEVLQEALETQVIPIVKNKRKLLGELDHPKPTGNPKVDMVVQSNVYNANASHLFTDIWMDGDYVVAEVENLLTSKGQEMGALIADNIEIGFSLRAFGKINPDPKTGAIIVNPLKRIVTWDCVSNPSHKEAVIQEILESDLSLPFGEIDKISSVLESVYNQSDGGLLLESNSDSNFNLCVEEFCYPTIETAVSVRFDDVLNIWKEKLLK